VPRAQRLARVDIQRRASQVPAIQCVRERALIDDPAAGEVGDDGARGEPAELSRSDHPARLVRERRVDGEHERLTEQLVECRRPASPQCVEAGFTNIGVVRHHRHPERVGPRRDLATDAPQADDAERAPAELAAHERGPIPRTRVHRVVGLRDVPE
jgi:hypothetical protein